ncbi:unnamed protein product, partial [Trichogramma brassicae]
NTIATGSHRVQAVAGKLLTKSAKKIQATGQNCFSFNFDEEKMFIKELQELNFSLQYNHQSRPMNKYMRRRELFIGARSTHRYICTVRPAISGHKMLEHIVAFVMLLQLLLFFLLLSLRQRRRYVIQRLLCKEDVVKRDGLHFAIWENNSKGKIAQLESCFCMQLIKLVQPVNCTDASRCIIRIKYRLMVQIRRKAINKTALWSLRGPLVEKRTYKSMDWLQEKMEGPRERNCERIVTHTHAVSPVSREKIYLGGFFSNEDSISFAHTSTTMRQNAVTIIRGQIFRGYFALMREISIKCRSVNDVRLEIQHARNHIIRTRRRFLYATAHVLFCCCTATEYCCSSCCFSCSSATNFTTTSTAVTATTTAATTTTTNTNSHACSKQTLHTHPLTASISRIRQMPALLLAWRSIEEGMVDSLVTQLATGAPSLQLTLFLLMHIRTHVYQRRIFIVGLRARVAEYTHRRRCRSSRENDVYITAVVYKELKMAYNLRPRKIIDELLENDYSDEEIIEKSSDASSTSGNEDSSSNEDDSDVEMEDVSLNQRLNESRARGRPITKLKGKNGFCWDNTFSLLEDQANKNGSGARARAPSSLRSMRSRGGGISRVLSVCVLQARANLHQWTECAVLCGIRYCKLDHFRALCYSEKRLRSAHIKRVALHEYFTYGNSLWRVKSVLPFTIQFAGALHPVQTCDVVGEFDDESTSCFCKQLAVQCRLQLPRLLLPTIHEPRTIITIMMQLVRLLGLLLLLAADSCRGEIIVGARPPGRGQRAPQPLCSRFGPITVRWTECAVLCGIRYCKLDHFRALCYSEKRLRSAHIKRVALHEYFTYGNSLWRVKSVLPFTIQFAGALHPVQTCDVVGEFDDESTSCFCKQLAVQCRLQLPRLLLPTIHEPRTIITIMMQLVRLLGLLLLLAADSCRGEIIVGARPPGRGQRAPQPLCSRFGPITVRWTECAVLCGIRYCKLDHFRALCYSEKRLRSAHIKRVALHEYFTYGNSLWRVKSVLPFTIQFAGALHPVQTCDVVGEFDDESTSCFCKQLAVQCRLQLPRLLLPTIHEPRTIITIMMQLVRLLGLLLLLAADSCRGEIIVGARPPGRGQRAPQPLCSRFGPITVRWTECAVLCGIRYCKLDHFRALCYSEKRLRRYCMIFFQK